MLMLVGEWSFSSSFSFFAFESSSAFSASLVCATFSAALEFFKGLNLLFDKAPDLGVFYMGDEFLFSLSSITIIDPLESIIDTELRFLSVNSAIT